VCCCQWCCVLVVAVMVPARRVARCVHCYEEVVSGNIINISSTCFRCLYTHHQEGYSYNQKTTPWAATHSTTCPPDNGCKGTRNMLRKYW
jgi:hypothetical protein